MSYAVDEGTGLRIKTMPGNIFNEHRPQMTRGDPIICGLLCLGGLQQRFTLKKPSCYEMSGKVSNLDKFFGWI
jgi:hypothetical protein